MIRKWTILTFLFAFPLSCEQGVDVQEYNLEADDPTQSTYEINFSDIHIIEFIRFVTKISGKNFVFNSKELNFHISLSTGTSVSSEKVVQALIQLLKRHDLCVTEDGDYYVIHKVLEGQSKPSEEMEKFAKPKIIPSTFFVYKLQNRQGAEVHQELQQVAAQWQEWGGGGALHKLVQAIKALQWIQGTNSLIASSDSETLEQLGKLIADFDLPAKKEESVDEIAKKEEPVQEEISPYTFLTYKVQYHEGSEIEQSLKKIAMDLKLEPNAPARLISAIQSLQWIKATNSLLCSADPETLEQLYMLIEDLDRPLRQVFVEVLVIETDVHQSTEFGLEWAAGAQYRNRVGGTVGQFAPGKDGVSSFGQSMQNRSNRTPGIANIPLGAGFDLGIIGDILLHKGKSYLSLGSLVHALQGDGKSKIVLKQNIITQDNKSSTIFCGDTVPFTGSVVQTVGQGQQTTANIDYRDIGVRLNIKTRLGQGEIITLDIEEEISETVDALPTAVTNSVNGIRTTKTNMATSVHVPDKHFLVLSSMIRNAQAHHKMGLPCLGGIPGLGALFSKTKNDQEKRNVLIFVRPHIIHSFEDYQNLTDTQEEHPQDDA